MAGSARASTGEMAMAEMPMTLTCADYARVMPLATGEVKPEGISLTLLLGSRGSWPARAEMLRRAVQDPEVQGGEWSMAQYLYRVDKGDKSYVGLPVFPLRNFTARDLYVKRGGPVRRPEDLAGKRIGMYSYTASGSIWYRHFLRWVGVEPGGHQVVGRRHRHAVVGDADGRPRAAARGQRAAGREVALRHAPRRRARGHLQPAAPGGLSPACTARSPDCSPTSAAWSRSTSGDRRLPAPASDRAAARGVGGEPLDRPEPHRGVRRPPTIASPPRRRASRTPPRGSRPSWRTPRR